MQCYEKLEKKMKAKQLEVLLTESFSQYLGHWKSTRHQGKLTNTLIISVSDGYKRAKVITVTVSNDDWAEKGKRVLEKIIDKLKWVAKKFDNPLKWLRLEWVSQERELTWADFKTELKRYKRNYYRSGIAFEGKREPWLLLTEMELNANACLYLGQDIPHAGVNQNNLEVYFKARHGSSQLPDFHDELPIFTFNTAGVFLNVDTGECLELETKPRQKGRRVMRPLSSDSLTPIITQSTTYLANQVQPTGKYVYGYFPCFDRTINTYNALRHASSTYALIEGYEACKKIGTFSDQQLKEMLSQIDNALDYTANTLIRTYGYKSYVVDTGDEIKLGANAVAILAFVKYIQVFPNNAKTERYLSIANKLALGILDIQQDDGSFVHVLNSKDLTLKQKNRIIYYDGEAAFALMRLYGLTKDERWLNCVEKAFDYFIEAKHYRAHDHWLSYCSNELVLYKPERKYFQFAVDNIKGYTDFIKNRITTFPTLLELSMAFHKMLLKLDDYSEYHDVLEGFDVHDFYQALHARANYLLNGFFFPEVAMFFKAPNTILHGFFIRHHSFRVRIDDVEHYLSGLVAYQELMATQKYPISVTQMNRSFLQGDSVLTPKALETATGGQWLVHPEKEWSASGLCIHPGSFKEGCLLVARGKNMEKGYLPKVSVKSFTLKGAGAIVTDNEEGYLDFGVPVLLVSNVRQATLDIGKWSRKYFSGDVIGVTGSAGKTTTVAMLSHALQIQGEVAQTKGSANLPIGIAWNMASMSQTAKTWVLEMAIGNMALNAQLAQPNMAIVTNIAAAHLEYHDTLDMVAIKKSRIFEGMRPGEFAIICRDIEQYELIAKKATMQGLTIINYGEHKDSDIRLINYKPAVAQISIHGQMYTLEMSSIGKHMVLNAMAVLAIADCKSLDIAKVIKQLNSFSAIEGRGKVLKISFEGKQVTVYNEAYNANPLSMKAALKAFSEVCVPAENKLVILGDMLELGTNSQQYHLDLAQDIKDVDCREIILVGGLVLELAQELKKLDKVVHHFKTKDLLTEQLSQIINDNDSVLIKASNGINLGELFSESISDSRTKVSGLKIESKKHDILKNVLNKFDTKASILVEQFKLKNNEITNQETLITVNENKRQAIASLSKLMTVLLVWEKVKQDQTDLDGALVTIPISLLPGSSKYYQFYKKNEKVDLQTAIKSALIASSNEGAFALALWRSNSEEKFVVCMNEKAKELGLSNTLFTSSTGLDRHAYTTVEDMSILAKTFITQCAPILIYTSYKSFEYKGKRVNSTNKLINKYPEIKGLKTGNLVGVGSNLINYWVDDGVHYLSIVLGAENSILRFEVSESILQATKR